MNLTPADIKMIPKDCMQTGVPKLPCDTSENKDSSEYPSLAMAYVPVQKFRELYKEDYAMQIGTIFQELDKPFLGIGGTLV